jgi:drug/metabolite transporter (DMT)-like permease
LGFILFCLTAFLYVVGGIESLFTSVYANINPGVITIIWRSSIFLSALADYILFGQKLKYYHFIGLISCVTCNVLIVLSKIVYPEKVGDKMNLNLFPAWVPILIALIMAIALTSNTM